MPAAAIIPAVIGAGTSIAGGLIGSSASKSAANTQYQATQQAQAYLKQLLEQYNPGIGDAAQKAADLVTGAGGEAVTGMQGTLAQNRSDVLGGVDQANALLQPYLQLGQYGSDTAKTLAGLMAPGGDLNRTFSFQDIQDLDPGYQFRMDQASKALQASAAAKGGAMGGGVLQALSNLNQNLASSEAGAAFSRLQQQQQQRYGMLSGFMNSMLGYGSDAATRMGANITGANQFLAGQNLTGTTTMGNWMIDPAKYAGTMGYDAANAMANNAMTTGKNITELMTQGGNAQAAGTVGSANAWTSALGGVGSAAGQVGKYYSDQNMMSQFMNPAIVSPNSRTPYTPAGVRNPWGYS